MLKCPKCGHEYPDERSIKGGKAGRGPAKARPSEVYRAGANKRWDAYRTKKQSVWIDVLKSQNGKCAHCHKPLAIENSAKYSGSFEVICKHCFKKPSAGKTFIYYSEASVTLEKTNPSNAGQ